MNVDDPLEDLAAKGGVQRTDRMELAELPRRMTRPSLTSADAPWRGRFTGVFNFNLQLGRPT
jgi:hypothetical protein